MIERFDSKPRTLKEIATYYNVAPKTAKKWIKELKDIYPLQNSNYYSVIDVQRIIKELGEAL